MKGHTHILLSTVCLFHITAFIYSSAACLLFGGGELASILPFGDKYCLRLLPIHACQQIFLHYSLFLSPVLHRPPLIFHCPHNFCAAICPTFQYFNIYTSFLELHGLPCASTLAASSSLFQSFNSLSFFKCFSLSRLHSILHTHSICVISLILVPFSTTQNL